MRRAHVTVPNSRELPPGGQQATAQAINDVRCRTHASKQKKRYIHDIHTCTCMYLGTSQCTDMYDHRDCMISFLSDDAFYNTCISRVSRRSNRYYVDSIDTHPTCTCKHIQDHCIKEDQTMMEKTPP